MKVSKKNRCLGNEAGQEIYARYHDEEWGVPVYDDKKLFEMLILEGAQAGLSWWVVLKKRQAYAEAFCDFDPEKVADFSDKNLSSLCHNPKIIRHRLKIYSTRTNAKIFLQIQKEFGCFSDYLWSFVGGKPIINHWEKSAEVPTTTPQSDRLSKDLKKRGMTFVGSTIMYAYMQAVGMVDDHLQSCWRYHSRRP